MHILIRAGLVNPDYISGHTTGFAELKRFALERGFVHVESGPLVRSSYHAHEQADAYERSK